MIKRIVIFGRPGSGKSTAARKIAEALRLPLYHLDAFFYEAGWKERDYNSFILSLEEIVAHERWIIDGNNSRSLGIRWSRAHLVIYLNFPRALCYFRVIKRYCKPNNYNDRAPGCKETMRFSLLRYIWHFESRFSPIVKEYKKKFPAISFKEIKSSKELKILLSELYRVAHK